MKSYFLDTLGQLYECMNITAANMGVNRQSNSSISLLKAAGSEQLLVDVVSFGEFTMRPYFDEPLQGLYIWTPGWLDPRCEPFLPWVLVL